MAKKVEDMDKYELKRWAALIEGVNLIVDKGLKSGIAFGDIEFKQNHLVTFIDEKTERIRLV